MDAITDIAEQRLHALRLAEEFSSVAEASRRSGMSRSQLYEWRRRVQADGVEDQAARAAHARSCEAAGCPVSD